MQAVPRAEAPTPFPGYDEATLRAARGDCFLLVDAGLAVAARWVARAAPGLRLALPTPASADEDTARHDRHHGLPGHRAAMRALLDDAQAHAERAAGPAVWRAPGREGAAKSPGWSGRAAGCWRCGATGPPTGWWCAKAGGG